jgi:hypothetical protein
MRSFPPLVRSINTARPAMFAIAAVLATLVAGCGSSNPPNTATQQASSGPGAAAFKFARCMRAHGVTDFPDPQVTSTGAGSASIRQVAPASAVASPRFKSAQKACGGLAPGPGNAGPDNQQPGAQVLLAFAHCLRGHGIAGFPDPNRNGRLNVQMITAAGVDYRSPKFLTAGTACLGVTHGAITRGQLDALVNGPH